MVIITHYTEIRGLEKLTARDTFNCKMIPVHIYFIKDLFLNEAEVDVIYKLTYFGLTNVKIKPIQVTSKTDWELKT